ncbi:MAG: hypothetical protein ACP5D7_01795 [Limnospira sp.]
MKLWSGGEEINELIEFTAARHGANPSPTIPLLLGFATVDQNTRIGRVPDRGWNVSESNRRESSCIRAAIWMGSVLMAIALPSRSGADWIRGGQLLF